jgi:hypothetical protein
MKYIKYSLLSLVNQSNQLSVKWYIALKSESHINLKLTNLLLMRKMIIL